MRNHFRQLRMLARVMKSTRWCFVSKDDRCRMIRTEHTGVPLCPLAFTVYRAMGTRVSNVSFYAYLRSIEVEDALALEIMHAADHDLELCATLRSKQLRTILLRNAELEDGGALQGVHRQSALGHWQCVCRQSAARRGYMHEARRFTALGLGHHSSVTRPRRRVSRLVCRFGGHCAGPRHASPRVWPRFCRRDC